MEVTHWLFRASDGENFRRSSIYGIWGIGNKASCHKHFIHNAKEGDILWFVKSNSDGLLLGCAKYRGLVKRQIGELVSLTMTNEELGWEGDKEWTYEVRYTDLYNITSLDLRSKIGGATGIRKYNDNCKVDLPKEYENIVRYSTVTRSM